MCYGCAMKEGPDTTEIAALLGDPARANMLSAMMSGLALTAGELAREAGVTPQTASAHLARLAAAGLVILEIQGRHRYYRLANPGVAEAIEALTGLAFRLERLRTRPGPRDEALRMARICYDHLAGTAGVAMHDALIAGGWLAAGDGGLAPTALGRRRFLAEGIDMAALEGRSRTLCRSCLDWSERRNHLAGSLGSALLDMILKRGWAKREAGTRALAFPNGGRRRFDTFIAGLTLPHADERTG